MLQDLTQQQQQHLITMDTAFQSQVCQSLLTDESQTEVPVSTGRRDVFNPKSESVRHSVVSGSCDPMDSSLPDSFVYGILSGKNTGVGSHSLLQGVFLTQG